jgi:DNA-binding CsgD family transcriptional regulator
MLASSPARSSNPRPRSLAELWSALALGELEIVASGYLARECFLKVRAGNGAMKRFDADGRAMTILKRVLIGDSQKCVAIELSLAPSTIAATSSRCLSVMGARGTASRVPMLLILAAHAGSGAHVASQLSFNTEGCGPDEFIIVASRPDIPLDTLLPTAEFEVAKNRLEGQSYEQIAKSRRRSKRTIANQLASIFRKFQVSGRVGLLRKLVRENALSCDGAVPSSWPTDLPLGITGQLG